jgi:hypothetical protein
MNRYAIISAVQSVAVVAVCAAVGLSLATVSGGENSSFLFMALGGAIVGLIGVVVGLMFRAPVQELERYRSPRQLVGLRIATISFIVAIAGWLITVFVSGALGYWVVVVGVLGGCTGIVIHRLQGGQAT